jgi:type II secretory pathway pseudopilin PulG
MNMQNSKTENQSGQTLIETIAAIAILVSALSSAVGLAIYSMRDNERAKAQIIAMNLAREGVEAVRNMRDTNWLLASVSNDNNFKLQSCPDAGGKMCYPAAFSMQDNPPNLGFDFKLPPSTPTRVPNEPTTNETTDNIRRWARIVFDPNPGTWRLQAAETGAGSITGRRYQLCLQPDGMYNANNNWISGEEPCPNESVRFARRTMFRYRTGTAYGFSAANIDNAEIIVRSIVYYTGRRCTGITGTGLIPDYWSSGIPCRVVVEERLTNWKDYR